MSTYKYIKDKKIHGPMSWNELKERVETGQLSGSTRVSSPQRPNSWCLVSVMMNTSEGPFYSPTVVSVLRGLAIVAFTIAALSLFTGEIAAALGIAGSALISWGFGEVIDYLAKIHHAVTKK